MEAFSELADERAGPHEDVPRVPALDAPEVDPERAEREHADDERPRVRRPEQPACHSMDQEERRQAEQQPRPRRGGEKQHVVKDRHAAVDPDVLQVGDDVRRVREEEQPQRPERGQLYAGRRRGPCVDEQGQQERHPREHEVPGDPGVVAGPGVDHAKGEHRQREQREDGQRPDDGDPPVAERPPQPLDHPETLACEQLDE